MSGNGKNSRGRSGTKTDERAAVAGGRSRRSSIVRDRELAALDPDLDPCEGSPELEKMVRRQLALFGEDPDSEGLLKTPQRVAKSLKWLTRGYSIDIKDVVGDAVFTE